MTSLAGRKILVVGASYGSGRATAIAMVRHGADVVFAARSRDALDEAVTEAGGGHVVTVDVTDTDSIDAAVAATVQELGHIDGIVYSAGMSPMVRLSELTPDQWQMIFAINTFGPNLLTAAALPHLSADSVVAVFSSDSAVEPRHSLTPYAASKAALEATMEGWRTEEIGGRRFLTIVLGPTGPSNFSSNFDPEGFAAVIPHWQRQGFRTGMLDADDVGEHLASTFGMLFSSPTYGIETILLRAPEPDEAPSDFGASDTWEDFG